MKAISRMQSIEGEAVALDYVARKLQVVAGTVSSHRDQSHCLHRGDYDCKYDNHSSCYEVEDRSLTIPHPSPFLGILIEADG